MIKKIIIVVVVLVVVSMITMGVLSNNYVKFNNTPKGNNEKVLKSTEESPKKALVVYQPSNSKLTDKIALKIAEGINKAGYEVTINYPGDHLSTDISQYSIVALGSPVYAQQISNVMQDYIKKVDDFSSSRVILFTTSFGLSNGLETLESLLKGVKPYAESNFKNPGGNDNETKAYEFGLNSAK